MKAKRVQIRQWMLFAVLVTIALYLHLRFPLESVVQPPADEQSLDANASDAGDSMADGDPMAAPSSAPLATMPSAPFKQDERRTHGAHETPHAGSTATSLDMPVPFAPTLSSDARAHSTLRAPTRLRPPHRVEI